MTLSEGLGMALVSFAYSRQLVKSNMVAINMKKS